MQNNRSTFAILFYLNTSKKTGNCPVMGRISIDGKSSAFSTGLELLPEGGMADKALSQVNHGKKQALTKRLKTTDLN